MIQVELNRSPTMNVDIGSSNPLGVDLGQGGSAGTRDYERLKNKPQINGVTLIGNLFLSDLFPDGIIINGGDATGYEPPIVPTGVPYAEGVGF